jgi:hypothetical protein
MPDSITEFWDLFREHAPALAATRSAETAVYDELLEALHKTNPDLYLEFSADGSGGELIVTADGNAALFPDARSGTFDPRTPGRTARPAVAVGPS